MTLPRDMGCGLHVFNVVFNRFQAISQLYFYMPLSHQFAYTPTAIFHELIFLVELY